MLFNFFGKSLEEAEKENTLPSLIKMYYEGMGLSLKDSDIVKDMERLERIKNEKELNFKSLEMIIKFIAQIHIFYFHFIVSEIQIQFCKPFFV